LTKGKTLNPQLMQVLFPQQKKKKDEGVCPICDHYINELEFRNEIAFVEYLSSGICQGCQDELLIKDDQ